GDAALLFERVSGSSMPVLGNFLASPANVEAAFGLDRDGIRAAMTRAISAPIAPETVTDPACQQVVIRHSETPIDLGSLLPALH
ncbi:MAG TPA: UbiD family decarboxylase, partial [Ilumatobacteraceae bacterium]|nr:UbiD family decarboxylase [Ilumatobacteraceae bacterium]